MIAQVQRSIFQRWTNDRNSRAKVTIGQQDSQSRPNHWAAPRESKQARLVDGGFGRLAGHGGGRAASSRGRGDRQRAGCRSPWRDSWRGGGRCCRSPWRGLVGRSALRGGVAFPQQLAERGEVVLQGLPLAAVIERGGRLSAAFRAGG